MKYRIRLEKGTNLQLGSCLTSSPPDVILPIQAMTFTIDCKLCLPNTRD